MEVIAEINNLLMQIQVKGDDVHRLAEAMRLCVEHFSYLEKESKNDPE